MCKILVIATIFLIFYSPSPIQTAILVGGTLISVFCFAMAKLIYDIPKKYPDLYREIKERENRRRLDRKMVDFLIEAHYNSFINKKKSLNQKKDDI